MRRSYLALVAATIGLAASSASLYDYLGLAPAFCAETGCATVRASAWSHPLGVPMPLLGIAFFATMLALLFIDAPRLRKALAAAGGAWALLLIGLQAFSIGAWCKLCMIADPSALVLAAAVLAGGRTIAMPWWKRLAIGPAAAGIVLVLALWSKPEVPPPLPDGTPAFVVAEQRAGVVTIVEVVDFECPYCRMMQAKVEEAVAKSKVPARIVRRMMPLPRHPHAMPAALAYCCADRQGKGEALAKELFAAPEETMTPEGCEALAVKVGCDLAQYRRDLPLSVGRVASESITARSSGVKSLPTLFIGGEQVIGATLDTDQIVAAIERQKI